MNRSMRARTLGVIAALSLVAGTVVATAPAQAATGKNCKVNTPTELADCDLITVALVNKVLTLDPANPGRTTNQNYVTKLPTSGLLFRYDAEGIAQPDLVDTYTVSPDGLTYTMKLKKGLKYSDGVTPVQADDAVFVWEYALNPPPPGFTGVTKVSAPDPQTVVVTLSKPFADFPRAMANVFWPLHPRSKAQGNPAYWNNPLSAGPFRIKSWVQGGDEFLVEANPNYWAKPAVKQVRFLAIPDPVTRVLAVKQGTVDYAFDLPATIGRNTLSDPAKYRGQPFQLQGNFTIDFNLRNQADKPWADPKVRQALSLALDRQQISDLAFNGDMIPSCALLYPTHPNYLCVKPGGTKQDLTAAKNLLAQTKWPNGFDIRLSTFNRPGWADAAAVVASQWKRIGVNATVVAEPDAVGLAGQNNGTFEAQWSGYGGAWPSGGLATYIGQAGAWRVWSGSTSADQFINEYDAAQSKAAQQNVLRTIEKLIWDESAHIPVGQRSGWGSSRLPEGVFSNSKATDLYYVKQTPPLGGATAPVKPVASPKPTVSPSRRPAS